MDRFIVTARTSPGLVVCYLKSNMDRFIVYGLLVLDFLIFDLKSNMDRFIDNPKKQNDYSIRLFKIQYG